MSRILNVNNYLFISPKKIGISVNESKDFSEIYKKEIHISEKTNQINFGLINAFLENNIFKIEKILNNFVKKINLIIECKSFLTVSLSIKKNNHNELITKENLIYYLNDAKDQCKKTIEKKKIIHMIIENYRIDNNNYSYFPEKLKCDTITLDIKLICLDETFLENLKKILKNYQISIDHIVNADYIFQMSEEKNIDYYRISKEVINGSNKNEILLIDKTQKNRGFFEKFFNFFN